MAGNGKALTLGIGAVVLAVGGAATAAALRDPGPLTLEQLLALMPRAPLDQRAAYLRHLNRAMAEGAISPSPTRMAAFLAQLAHESGELRFWVELPHNSAVPSCRLCRSGQVPHAAGEQYEGWTERLGNIHRGDGPRFKGRGPIQLTGRDNYRAAGRALGLDLEASPELAARADTGFRVAVWFWNSRKLSTYADAGDFDAITYRINGGYNGKAERDAYHRKALQVLSRVPQKGSAP
jgi:putative chitinase